MTTRRSMLRTGAVAALALSAGATTAGTALAAPAPSETRTRPDTAALRAALDQMVAVAASGVLVELREADWVWRATAGVAEFGSTRPVPANGRFRVGSVTTASGCRRSPFPAGSRCGGTPEASSATRRSR